MDSRISETAYQEALDWLYSRLPMFSRIGAAAYKPGLQTTESLDSLFGHPHRKFKAIHVAGTNGKGSTSHMIASALQAAGFKTALYTSPHLTDFRERMRINGRMIPKDNVVRFVNEWRMKDSPLQPSFFELTMMMAFDWFANEHVDYAVIEVGMGGRLDSTNIIKPVLSIITNISFDHTQFLGETLEAIAGEKAGIIKRGIPVVIGQAEGAVKQIFEKKAAEMKSPLYLAQDFQEVTFTGHNAFEWKVKLDSGVSFDVPLGGNYQKHNIRTALCALQVLRDSGIRITDESVAKGLSNVISATGLRGRWQIVNENPVVICDTGHNIDGLSQTLETLKELHPGKRVRFVIGFVNDKDVEHIVDCFPKDGEYYFTQASIPRAMQAEDVAGIFASHGYRGRIVKDIDEAYRAALSDSMEEDVIYIGGSTFVVADFLALNG